MTDSEIKKALEKAINEYAAEDVGSAKYFKLIIAILDLFNRQRAEIERLRAECWNQSALWNKHFEGIFETAKETIKAEAIKEFAERLKQEVEMISYEMCSNYQDTIDAIDETYKEMVVDVE